LDKELARDTFNWDGIKNTKSRKLLSDLKDIATHWDDIPFKKVITQIGASIYAGTFSIHCAYFCTCIREPIEIEKLMNHCKEEGISCYSIWVRNPKAEEEAKTLDNHADLNYMKYTYSYMVGNNTSLSCFQHHIETLIGIIKKREENVHNDSGSDQIKEE